MDKLITDINGKFPYVLDDIRFLDAAYRMGFEALARATSFNRNSILYGCKITDLGGNNISVSEGAVLINGEILFFSESQISVTTGNKPVIIKEENFDPAGNKLFGDGTQHDTYKKIFGKLTLVPQNATGDFVDIYNSPRISEISDFDGLIYKGELKDTDNLDNVNKTGLYTIKGDSLPVNFPDDVILGASIEQSSNFWFKNIYVGRTDKFYQEIGFKKGLLARRYLHNGSSGWSDWFSFWASKQDVLDGTKKCSVISPYMLQKHGDWVHPNGGSGASTSELWVRKLNNGLIQIQGLTQQASHVTFTLAGVLASEYRPTHTLKVPVIADGNPETLTINPTNGEMRVPSPVSEIYTNIIFDKSV